MKKPSVSLSRFLSRNVLPSVHSPLSLFLCRFLTQIHKHTHTLVHTHVPYLYMYQSRLPFSLFVFPLPRNRHSLPFRPTVGERLLHNEILRHIYQYCSSIRLLQHLNGKQANMRTPTSSAETQLFLRSRRSSCCRGLLLLLLMLLLISLLLLLLLTL